MSADGPGPPPAPGLLPPPLATVRRGLRQARWRQFRHALRTRAAAGRFRLAVVLGTSLLFAGVVFTLFFMGFRELAEHQVVGQAVLEGLFRIFFGALLTMLAFSSGILLYAGLFQSRETEFLLSGPTPRDQIFAFKFQEAAFFSAWAFLMLGGPMALAYGLATGAPWRYYVLAPWFFAAFVLAPASVGAILSLIVARFAPTRRWGMLALIAAFPLALAAHAAWQTYRNAAGSRDAGVWLQQVLTAVRSADAAFLPSQWMARGLLAAGYADPEAVPTALRLLALLAGHAGALYLLAAWLHGRLLGRAFDRVRTEVVQVRRRAAQPPALLRLALRPFPVPLRALILKDLRGFVRDPAQWSQALIFCGLLGLYFVALGRMDYYTRSPYWRNLVAFFNVAVTGLILATYTSRFIFPLLSLEGRQIWMLGLAPVSRTAILWAKFAFAAGGALLGAMALTLLGGWMLRLEPLLLVVQLATAAALASGLSGLAVGLGAKFADPRETDPSRLAAGFGGTLNLVFSLMFLSVAVGLMALPCHLYASWLAFHDNGGDSAEAARYRGWIAVAGGACLAVSAVATFVPMRLGARSFEQREF